MRLRWASARAFAGNRSIIRNGFRTSGTVRVKARIASIFTQLVNFCWSFFKWSLLLTCVGAVAVGGYLYFKLDDEIRRQVELRFAKHYKDFVVKVGSARFDPERGIAVDDFSLTPKGAAGEAGPILTIDELYLSGKMRVEQLVLNQLQISDILVRKAKLRMVREADGAWNTGTLFPLPHFSDDYPRISIEDASATVQYTANAQSKPWLLQGINLQLTPIGPDPQQPKSAVQFQIAGNANGLPARELRIDGRLGPADGFLNAAVTVAGLDISQKLIATLPESVTAKLAGTEVSGQADIRLTLLRRNRHAATGWAAAFRVDHGRFFRAPLPEPLTDVLLEGEADSQKLAIKQMSGRFGSANFAIAVNRAGWAGGAPLALTAKITGYTLTEQLQNTLPESQARIWQRFRPLGPVDADVRLTFDGTNWKPLVTAQCRGISLTDMEKFPYKVEQTTGPVVYRAAENGSPDRLTLDLTGAGGGRPIRVVANLTHLAPEDPQGPTMGEGVAGKRDVPAPVLPQSGAYAAGYRGVRFARGERVRPVHPVGFVEVSGTDIPLHEQLVVALPKKASDLVRDLHGQGLIDFCFHAEWKDLSQAQCEVRQDIRLKDCRVQYGPFPYPLQRVQGLVTERNGVWALSEFEAHGSNDSAIVRCHGGVKPHDSGCEADLVFEATNVPLDDNLRRALTPAGQQAWTELAPQGNLDFIAHITRQPHELEPNVEVTLKPRGRSVSIELRSFPYKLDEVEGVATYRRGRVDWQNIVAHHDRSVYTVGSGSWQTAADGGWQCNLNGVNIDRVSTSRDLIAAIPPGLQTVLDRLQPSGAIGLYNGNFAFVKSPQSQALGAAWDVSLECQQTSLQCSLPLRGINGGVRIVGRSDGRNAFVSGKFALDTVLCKDVQLTNVRGPFWADATHFLAGEPACKQQNLPEQTRVIADAYGGSLATNIEFVHDANAGYNIDMRLGGANLGRFANERLGGPNDLNGTLSGKVVISGTGTTMQTMRGSGELHVVDANIYQLPVLVAMLKVLRNRTPDTTAFNRCDLKFAIQGEHVHFEQLNLLGDAVSLYGNGDTDLSRRLDLVFYTLVGPVDLPIPGWKTLAGHVSQQGLQLKVVGTLDDPKIERRALPAVNDMLDQMQADFQGGGAAASSSTAGRGAKSPAR